MVKPKNQKPVRPATPVVDEVLIKDFFKAFYPFQLETVLHINAQGDEVCDFINGQGLFASKASPDEEDELAGLPKHDYVVGFHLPEDESLLNAGKDLANKGFFFHMWNGAVHTGVIDGEGDNAVIN